MSAGPPIFPEHPTRHNSPMRVALILGTVFGGPLAWFLQLCAGYALASQPCFREGHRLLVPRPGAHWSGAAMVACMIAAIVIALLAFMSSLSAFRQLRAEQASQMPDDEVSRTRFLAVWGMILSLGFALVTSFTAVAFATLPRCAG